MHTIFLSIPFTAAHIPVAAFVLGFILSGFVFLIGLHMQLDSHDNEADK